MIQGGEKMKELNCLSFRVLDRRELQKGWGWWVGLVAAVTTAAAAYIAANPPAPGK